MDTVGVDIEGCSAWNPGVRPNIPSEFRHLETIFHPDATVRTRAEVDEFASLTGMPHQELAAFQARRLALHELIIRITALVAVAEGAEEEEFGHNFRDVVLSIWSRYIEPRADGVERLYADLRARIDRHTREILEDALKTRTPSTPPPGFSVSRLWRRPPPSPAPEPDDQRRQRIISQFKATGLQERDPLRREIFRSLYRIACSMNGAHGQFLANVDLLSRLVSAHAANSYGSQVIGDAIAPLIDEAIEHEGYRRVSTQAAPVIFSLKGASAAGKSSLRPLLKQMMQKQGIRPDAFITISPDVWRRLLLDYDALGVARKYAGHLTGREVALIDAKLDRYIRDKADREEAIPHVMLDRFRFDSFSSESVPRVLDVTYAKYVDTMHMYFIVTPPEETVVRGWRRALERGRYKSVEEFLDHSVEAYTGMPKLLFRWLGYKTLRFRYHFLDNDVPKGAFPKLAAVGDQQIMTIYDPLILIAIERYQKINIHATKPAEVYPAPPDMAPARNLRLLKECIRHIPEVVFARQRDGAPYLRVVRGSWEVVDGGVLQEALSDHEVAETLSSLSLVVAART